MQGIGNYGLHWTFLNSVMLLFQLNYENKEWKDALQLEVHRISKYILSEHDSFLEYSTM